MLRDLAEADWTRRAGLAALTAALGAENIRWVGGAVRDGLLGVPVHDAATHRLTIEWSGADPELDPLVYTLQFTCDNGATWETLQVKVALSTVSVDGAKKNLGVEHFETALKLNPDSAIARIEFANGLAMMFGSSRIKDAERYYREAANCKPADAMEWLDVESAKSELDG